MTILTNDPSRDLRDQPPGSAPLSLPGELDLYRPLDNPRDTAEALTWRDDIGHVRRRRDWLPEGMHERVDAARLEHVAALARLEDAVKACHALAERFDQEDADYRQAVYMAARQAAPPSNEGRTPATQRQAEAEHAIENAWAHVQVLAEVVDACRQTLAEVEAEVISELREQEAKAEQERQAAIRKAQEAAAAKVAIQRRGRWLLAENDGTALGGAQPSPVVDPSTIDLSRTTDDPSALTRHWTRQERMDQERAA